MNAPGLTRLPAGQSRGAWLALTALCVAAFVSLSSRFTDFVLDDAYIAYRYAENLVAGDGLTWNPGEDPVEGYTSTLWVMLHAGALAVGFKEPVKVSKSIGLLCSLATILALSWEARRLPWQLAASLLFGIALNPGYAYLSMQGLETSSAALLVLMTAWALFGGRDGDSHPRYGLAALLLMLAFLSRADTLLATGPLYAAAAAIDARRAPVSRRRALIVGLSTLAALVAFNAWRWAYFGYPLPNTAYVKQAAVPLIKAGGVSSVAGFGLNLLLPYVFLLLVTRLAPQLRAAPNTALAILLATLPFGLYLITVNPIQGEFWRFLMPIYPTLLFGLATALPARVQAGLPARWTLALLLAAMAIGALNLRFLPQALSLAEQKNSRDRVIIGQQLAGLDGTLFTSEAGAIPYYSRWRSADLLGLTSETIVHEGLSKRFLQKLDPDLIVLYHQGPFALDREGYDLIAEFMREEGYWPIAATVKASDKYHFYFVKGDSPLAHEIERRIESAPEVRFGNINQLTAGFNTLPADEPAVPAP